MRRLCACILLLPLTCLPASNDASVILESARQAVAAQLARVANYSCIETIERKYFIEHGRPGRGCAPPSPLALPELWMHDRLRLDVAVSEGREIYSWHATEKFTSSTVTDVVQTGPISSGNFVGFLENIFRKGGARFEYSGQSSRNGVKSYHFNFAVPVSHSTYHIKTVRGNPVIPFHGSFSVAAADDRLLALQVIADAIPPDSTICSAETDITYQVVPISGRPSLLPASFVLKLEDETHVQTVSGSEYSGCREFRGESTLHFDAEENPATLSAEPARVIPWLPAGVSLQVQLQTPSDDRTSYVGDPVQGTLLQPIKIPGLATLIPRGALLDGIITKLEDHYLPADFRLFSVHFDSIHFGQTSFRLNASPRTSTHDRKLLRNIYGSHIIADVEQGRNEFVLLSHLRPNRRFAGEWITSRSSGPAANLSEPR